MRSANNGPGRDENTSSCDAQVNCEPNTDMYEMYEVYIMPFIIQESSLLLVYQISNTLGSVLCMYERTYYAIDDKAYDGEIPKTLFSPSYSIRYLMRISQSIQV